MNTNYFNKLLKSLLILILMTSGHNNVFTQSPGYTANDQVPPYNGPFHYGTNMGYYPGWTDGQVGDLAAGNPALNIPGIGATTLRPGLFEHYLEDFGYEVNIPWFQHFESLGLEDHTMFVGYPSPAHQDPNFYCATSQSTVFDNMYLPIWDGGANGTPVNDDNYYALFLYKMVTLYGPYIKFWEIWNEPDLDFSPNGMGWRSPGDPAGSWWDDNPDPCDIQLAAPIFHYNRLLRISFEVIKSIDPDAYVTVGGLGFPSFLDALMRNTDNPVDGSVTAEYPLKGGAYFDVLSFHSYPHINGSLLIWDPINGITGYQRHSDAAIAGITEDLNDFKAVMNTYGYDGNTFPEKEVIMTESSVPRKKFGDYIGSEEAALNYAIKLPIELQKEGVLHFHYYDLGEKEDFNSAMWPFQVTGFYEKLVGATPATIQRTNQGIAYKTVSNLLFEKTYDPVRTAALNLSSEIDGAAFKDDNNQYTYVLWSVCNTDDTESSFANYTFPSSFNLNSLESKSWDFSLTNQQDIVSAQSVALTGSPIFLTPSNQVISYTCPSDIEQMINAGQNGAVISWNPPTGTTQCNISTNLNIVQTGGPANGSSFPVGTSTITYSISDDCGNMETCNFNVIITQDPATITCANGQHEVTINVIGNGSVNIEFISPASPTETCATGTCIYCVDGGSLIKLVGVPDAGETFLGWSSGGCNGTGDCWKSISWETEITANFSEVVIPSVAVSATPSDVSCNGDTDGNVLLNVSGGTSPYTYNWSSGQSSPNLNNVAAGNYVVTVTDSNGLTATSAATVGQPTALVALISTFTDVSCSGGSDGTAVADATGGVGNFQYLWSNGNTTPFVSNLSSGSYTVTISDNNGCVATAMATIAGSNAVAPVADFSKTINLLEVSFTDISSDNPTSWSWEFGDGNSSTSSTVTHTYAAAGTYLACLTATNDCGSNISCQNISVGQTNSLDIVLESVTGNTGTVVQVPIRINNFEDVLSFQHSFIIPDTTKAIFVGTSNFLTSQLGSNVSISTTAETTNTIWLAPNGTPTTVIDGTALYYLDILIKGEPSVCVDILLDDQNFPTEFVVIENGNVAQVGFNITNGEVCATPGIIISGNIATETGLEIEDVELFDDTTFTTLSDFNGFYEFPQILAGSTVRVEPHKNTNPVNGVTSFDLAIIQQHILGNILLDSPYKIIAADIDNSNSISSFDLFLAQQVIINSADSFPNNESWRFVPTSFVFPDPTNPFLTAFPEHVNLVNVGANPPSIDFVAIKVGDVNQTALPNLLTGGSNNALTRDSETQLEFLVQQDETPQDGYFLDFFAKDFKNMSAFQFELSFDPEEMEFDRLEQNSLPVSYGTRLLQDGILSLIWFDQQGNGHNLDDNTSLFRIYFKEKKILSPNAMDLSIGNRITPPVAYDFSGNPSTINFTFLQKTETITLEENASIIVLQNKPNPFSLISKISFKMVIEDLVQVNIVDQHGGSVFATQKVFPAGTHQIELKASDFPSSGIYYYSFTTSTDRVVKKMVVLH